MSPPQPKPRAQKPAQRKSRGRKRKSESAPTQSARSATPRSRSRPSQRPRPQSAPSKIPPPRHPKEQTLRGHVDPLARLVSRLYEAQHIAKVARAIVLPEEYPAAFVPFEVGYTDRLLSTVTAYTLELDVSDLLSALQTEAALAHPPTISRRGRPPTEAPLWNLDNGFPLIHCNDAVTALIYPLPYEQLLRTWYYDCLDAPKCGSLSDGKSEVGMTLSYYNYGHTTVIPAPTPMTRPYCRTRDLQTCTDYVWADASSLKPCVFQLGGTLSLNAAMSTFSTVISATATLWSTDDGASTRISDSTVVTTSTGDNDFSITLEVVVSGFYALELLCSTSSSPAVAHLADLKNVSLQVQEATSVVTCFSHSSIMSSDLPNIASGYYVTGASALFSSDAPPLTTAGRIFGATLDQTYNDWAEAASDGLSVVSGRVPPARQAQGGQGYPVQKGAYVWEHGTQYQRKMAPCHLEVGPTGSRLAPSYLLQSDDGWNGFSLCVIKPSAVDSTHVVVRIRCAQAVTYTPATQLILPNDAAVFLMPDEGASLRQAMSRTRHFSENEWHETFVKVAAAVGRVGAALMSGLDYAHRKAAAVARVAPYVMAA